CAESARLQAREELPPRGEAAPRQAETASLQVSDFLLSIFEGTNPDEEIVDIPTSRLVAQAEAKIERELAAQPTVRSDIYFALARVQANLGNQDKAFAHYQRAIDL